MSIFSSLLSTYDPILLGISFDIVVILVILTTGISKFVLLSSWQLIVKHFWNLREHIKSLKALLDLYLCGFLIQGIICVSNCIFSCSEENVYRLCKKLCSAGIADSEGSDLFVVFISNDKKQASPTLLALFVY